MWVPDVGTRPCPSPSLPNHYLKIYSVLASKHERRKVDNSVTEYERNAAAQNGGDHFARTCSQLGILSLTPRSAAWMTRPLARL